MSNICALYHPELKVSFNFFPDSSTYVCFFVLFYQLFWTRACPEGMGTNGTHRSHARCHPYPIPEPGKAGHTTGVYVPYSFRTVAWVLLRPTRTDQWKCCETGPTVFRPYPRRLESLTIYMYGRARDNFRYNQKKLATGWNSFCTQGWVQSESILSEPKLNVYIQTVCIQCFIKKIKILYLSSITKAQMGSRSKN